MLKKFTFLIMLLFLGATSAFNQVDVVAFDECAPQNQQGGVGIFGFNVVDVTSIQFTLNYDPAVIASVDGFFIPPALDAIGTGVANSPAAGTIIFSWFSDDPKVGLTLPAGDELLLGVDVTAGAIPASFTVVEINGLEVSDVTSFPNPTASTAFDGSFTVECAALNNLLVLDLEAQGPAECDLTDYVVDVIVEDGFDTLNGVQFTLNWDPSVLSYQFVDNFAPIMDLEQNDFGEFPAAGQLTFAWYDDSNSLPDGAVLFSIHFSVVGPVGAFADIIEGDFPTFIQASVATTPLSTPIPIQFFQSVEDVVDFDPPSITCPDDVTVSNILGLPSQIVNGIAPVDVTDNCGPVDVTYTLMGATTGSGVDDASGEAFNIGDTKVTYTATDQGGNTDECSFNVHVNDTLTVYIEPQDVECGIEPTLIDVKVNNFTDLRGLQFTLTWDEDVLDFESIASIGLPPTAGFGDFGDTLSFSWFDDENIGKSFPDSFVIFTLAFNITGEVGDMTDIRFIEFPTPVEASTNGGVPPFVVPVRTIDGKATIVDTEEPFFPGPPGTPLPPDDLTVQCAGDVPAGMPLTASDFCDGSITVDPVDAITPGSCANDFVVTRTWTFTDNAGNTFVYTQIITVSDDTAPVAPAAPADITVQCATDVPAVPTLTAVDNCDGDIVGLPASSIAAGSCDNDFVITRSWTFTDVCGNSSSISQTITVSDDTAPVAPAPPADVTVQCATDVPAPVDLTAVDNCDGDITVSPTSQTTAGSCVNDFVMVRTWTFTDICGNTSSVSQTITVNDNTAPATPAAPGDLTLQCATDVPAPVDLTAVDNCDGDITVSPTIQITPGSCVNDFVEVRTWTFTDVCGNTSSVSQTITVNDDTNPVITGVPADITVECDMVPSPANPTATDNCGVVDLVYTETVIPGNCINNYTIIDSWTATDACGNTTTVSQEITVEDTTPPTFDFPAPQDETYQCAADVPAPFIPAPSDVSDNCSPEGSIDIAFDEQVDAGSCPNNFTLNRTWTITDECGNSSSISQTITVDDTTAPVAPAAPADVTLQCAADVPAPVDLTAVDNCDGDITVSPVDMTTQGACANSFVTVRTWTFVDVCGNTTSISQTISVNDDTAPVLSGVPADATVECDNVPAPAAVTASDNCDGTVSVSFNETSTPGSCPNNFTLTRTWTAVDGCGNSTTETQVITVQDTQAPTFDITLPGDVTVECDAIPAALTISSSDISDNCSSSNNINILDNATEVVTPGSCVGESTITRTWSIEDECGNINTVVQTITVEDNTAPTVLCQDITVELDEDGNATIEPADVDAGSSDNCSSVTLSLSQSTFECMNIGDVNVTLTGTDDCGNSSSCNLTVTVVDVLPPDIFCPNEIVVNLDPGACEAIVNYNVTATDNCEFMLTTTFLGTTFNDNNGFAGNMFDVSNIGAAGAITITSFDINLDAAVGFIADLEVYVTPNTFVGKTNDPSQWTLLGAGNAVSQGQGNPTPLPIGGLTIQPGESFGIYINLASYNIVTNRFLYTSGANTYTDANMQITTGVGKGAPAFTGATFNPRTWNGNIFYTVQIGGEPLVEQIDNSDLTSGDFYPIGTTNQIWKATDNEGNMSTCTFDVIVNEFPNPIPTLACNDEVNVALDPDCEAIVGADDILEGGPYGCYDDYIVELFDEAGNNLGNMLGAPQIGQVITAVVTDPENMNNFCETTVNVFDNLPPTIECSDVTVSCVESTDPDFIVGSSKVSEYEYFGDDTPIFDGCEDGTNVLEIPFIVDADGVVTDVDLELSIQHTWVGDLSAELVAPDGSVAVLFERPGTEDGKCYDTFANGEDDLGTSVDDINATFDQQATNTSEDFENLDVAGMSGSFKPYNSFNAMFNGKTAEGTWVLRIYDAVNSGVQTGNFLGAKLSISSGLVGGPLAEDACGDVTLDFVDSTVDGDCDDDFIKIITRVWTATDESGNTATCNQVITVARPSVNDVSFPADINDIDIPALDCSNPNTDPSNTGRPMINGIEVATGDMCELLVSFEDLVVELCEGSLKVLRTWTVMDNCTADMAQMDQLIKVLDKTGPQLMCPAPLTVGTKGNACLADVVLPMAVATDDCSSPDNISIVITADVGEFLNDNTLVNVPVGNYIITYTATDDCGNETVCEVPMTVQDDDPPVAICDEETVISLTTDGMATVCAETFDDGSTDNCEILAYKVKRMDAAPFEPFTDCVDFDCDDVNETIVVRLRVYDVIGNFSENDPTARFNECMVNVTVNDKLPPVITCPPNKTIDCWEFDPDKFDGVTVNPVNPNDPPVFLLPVNEQIGFYNASFDNCGVERVNVSQNGGPDQCGEGTVTRIYTAIDKQGLTASCVQIISIVNSTPFDICDTECWATPFFGCDTHSPDDGVEWPCDITLNSCGAGLDPDELENNPDVNEFDVRPRIFEDACDLVGVSFKDTELPITEPGCIKLIRKWSVVDWCQPDNSFPLGYVTWTFNQEIKVLESDPPTITSTCEDLTICGFEPDCEPIPVDLVIEGEDDCTDLDDLTYYYKIDAFFDPTDPNAPTFDFNSDFNPLANAGNAENEASGAYPIGLHLIQWKVEDGCGNIATCEYTFEVKDCKPPTPICKVLSTVIMPSSQMVTLNVSSFENGDSYDNCTPYEELLFSFSPDVTDTLITFDCLDVDAGQTTVTVYATDEYGNQDFCETTVFVTDPNDVCNLAPTATIAGAIETELNDPVALVDVEVTSSNGSNSPQMVTTGNDGVFSFQLPINDNYTITPEKDVNYLNGVTTFDLVMISQHILGIQPLATPYKIIAADATNDGKVTTFDIVELRKLILHIIDELPENNSWRFVEELYQFPNPANPFLPAFPEVIGINDLAQDELENNFVGVKIGDVSGDAVPNEFASSEDRNFVGDLVFQVEDRELIAGETYTVEFNAEAFNNILGYQFTLAFDNNALEFVAAREGQLVNLTADNFGLSRVEEGVITTSWNASNVSVEDNTALFALTFTAKANAQLSDVITVNSRLVKAEAYTATAQFMDVALRFNSAKGSVIVGGEFELYQNQPNPFKSETLIGFYLPEATSATLKIYDLSGKVIQVIEGDFNRGYNTVSLNRADLGAAGMLYYQLDTPKHTATKKMLIIE